jgi:hypothetical protein
MNADLARLLTMPANAHIVGISEHHCRFGAAHQPRCLDCDYVGPLVTPRRAQSIAREHTQKSLGKWEPAR